MYQSHFGLTKKPFSSLPDPAFLYKSPEHTTALAVLEHAVLRDAGVTVLSGETGCGKTTLIRHLINNQPASTNIGLVSLLRPDGDVLLPWILYAFGLDYETSGEVAQYDLLLNHLVDSFQEGKRSVLIVDEAHTMLDGSLEEIRMISNLNVDDNPLISIILVGHTQLHTRLISPSLAMLYQRVAAHCHIGPLSTPECGRYINARMRSAGGNSAVFSAGAIEALARASKGVPRVINALCETALLRAYTRGATTVNRELIDIVIQHRSENMDTSSYPAPSAQSSATDTERPALEVTDTPAEVDRSVDGNGPEPHTQPLRMWIDESAEVPAQAESAANPATAGHSETPAAVAPSPSPQRPQSAPETPRLVDIESPTNYVRQATTRTQTSTVNTVPTVRTQSTNVADNARGVRTLNAVPRETGDSSSVAAGSDQLRVQLKLLVDPRNNNAAVISVIRDLTRNGFRVLNHKTQFRERKRQLTLKVLVDWFGDATQIAPVVGKIEGIQSVLDIRFPQTDSADELLVRHPHTPDSAAPGRAQRQSLFGPEPF